MSYLIQSNTEYTKRVDEVEERLIKMMEKLELLEYNINMLSNAFNKELDTIADIVRSLKYEDN